MCFVYSQSKKYIFNCKYTFGLGSDLWITCLHLKVCVYVWCCVTVKMGITSSMASTRKLPVNKKHVRKNDNWECISVHLYRMWGWRNNSFMSQFLNCCRKNLHQQGRKATLIHISKNEKNIYPFTYYKVLHWNTLPQWKKMQQNVVFSWLFRADKTRKGRKGNTG